MDGPPTRMMYSPDVGDAACELRANMDKNETSKRRFMVIGASHYLCRRRNCASGRALSPSALRTRLYSRTARQLRLYHLGSVSLCTKSPHVCRFRISANLSPRT